MKLGKITALGVATLTLGLALGNAGAAMAVTDGASTPVSFVQSCGLAIGQSMRAAGGRLADVLASMTGMSVTDVQEKRRAGESIADIAKSKGVDSDAVVAKALAIRSEALEAKVKAGDITQAQADEAKKRMTDRLTERVTSKATGGNGAGAKRAGTSGTAGQGLRRRDGSGAGQGAGQGRGRGQGGGMGGNCDGSGTPAVTQ